MERSSNIKINSGFMKDLIAVDKDLYYTAVMESEYIDIDKVFEDEAVKQFLKVFDCSKDKNGLKKLAQKLVVLSNNICKLLNNEPLLISEYDKKRLSDEQIKKKEKRNSDNYHEYQELAKYYLEEAKSLINNNGEKLENELLSIYRMGREKALGLDRLEKQKGGNKQNGSAEIGNVANKREIKNKNSNITNHKSDNNKNNAGVSVEYKQGENKIGNAVEKLSDSFKEIYGRCDGYLDRSDVTDTICAILKDIGKFSKEEVDLIIDCLAKEHNVKFKDDNKNKINNLDKNKESNNKDKINKAVKESRDGFLSLLEAVPGATEDQMIDFMFSDTNKYSKEEQKAIVQQLFEEKNSNNSKNKNNNKNKEEYRNKKENNLNRIIDKEYEPKNNFNLNQQKNEKQIPVDMIMELPDSKGVRLGNLLNEIFDNKINFDLSRAFDLYLFVLVTFVNTEKGIKAIQLFYDLNKGDNLSGQNPSKEKNYNKAKRALYARLNEHMKNLGLIGKQRECFINRNNIFGFVGSDRNEVYGDFRSFVESPVYHLFSHNFRMCELERDFFNEISNHKYDDTYDETKKSFPGLLLELGQKGCISIDYFVKAFGKGLVRMSWRAAKNVLKNGDRYENPEGCISDEWKSRFFAYKRRRFEGLFESKSDKEENSKLVKCQGIIKSMAPDKDEIQNNVQQNNDFNPNVNNFINNSFSNQNWDQYR